MENLKYKTTKGELVEIYTSVLGMYRTIQPTETEQTIHKLNIRSFLKKIMLKLEGIKLNTPRHKTTMKVNINEYWSLNILFEDSGMYDRSKFPYESVLVNDLHTQMTKQLQQLQGITNAAGIAAAEIFE